jgi:tRNA G26 N,N-dimethylase Trm1
MKFPSPEKVKQIRERREQRVIRPDKGKIRRVLRRIRRDLRRGDTYCIVSDMFRELTVEEVSIVDTRLEKWGWRTVSTSISSTSFLTSSMHVRVEAIYEK